MSEKNLEPLPNRGDDEPVDTSRNDDAGYRVGYGRPPLETRFQKGKSGNPMGRPKNRRPKTRSVTLADAIECALDELVHLDDGRVFSKRDVIAKTHTSKAAKGDSGSLKIIASVTREKRGATGRSQKEVDELIAQAINEYSEAQRIEALEGAKEFTQKICDLRERMHEAGVIIMVPDPAGASPSMIPLTNLSPAEFSALLSGKDMLACDNNNPQHSNRRGRI